MKSFLFLFVFMYVYVFSFAQKSDMSLNDKIVVTGGTKLPSMKLLSVSTGEATDLAALIQRDLKYPDKPTLIVCWAKKWCGRVCFTRIDTLLEKQMDKQFNIITINVEGGSENIASVVSLTEIRQLISEKAGWNKMSHYQATYDAFDFTFFNRSGAATPYWMVLDKNLKLVTTFAGYGLPVQTFNEMLQDIESGNINLNEATTYFDANQLPVKKSKATYYYQRTVNGNRTTIKKNFLTGNKPLLEFSAISKNGIFSYDGPYNIYSAQGKLIEEATMQNGYRIKGKRWHTNGELMHEANVPVSGVGYFKSWRVDGSKEQELNYENSLLNGKSRSFDEAGNVNVEYNHTAGKLNGISKRFVVGILYQEYLFNGDSLVKTTVIEKNLKDIKQACIGTINSLIKKVNKTGFIPEVTNDGVVWPVNNGSTFKDSRGEYPGSISMVKWVGISRITDSEGEVTLWSKALTNYHTNTATQTVYYNQRTYGKLNSSDDGYKELIVAPGDEERVKTLLEFVRDTKWDK